MPLDCLRYPSATNSCYLFIPLAVCLYYTNSGGSLFNKNTTPMHTMRLTKSPSKNCENQHAFATVFSTPQGASHPGLVVSQLCHLNREGHGVANCTLSNNL